MAQSPLNTPVLSLTVANSLLLLEQDPAAAWDTVIAPNPEPWLQKYRGQIVIHSLALPDDPEEREITFEIFKLLDITQEMFPGNCIQGLAEVCDVFRYTSKRWAEDFKNHKHLWQTESLVEAECQMELWGVKLVNFQWLTEPVYDVFAPDWAVDESFWFANGPNAMLQLEAIRLALSAPLGEPLERIELPENN